MRTEPISCLAALRCRRAGETMGVWNEVGFLAGLAIIIASFAGVPQLGIPAFVSVDGVPGWFIGVAVAVLAK